MYRELYRKHPECRKFPACSKFLDGKVDISDFIESDEFGTTDDLYAIGYTSLTLMKLNTLIYKEMGVNLDISILFNSPTIKKLAAEILGSNDQSFKLDEFIEMAKNMEYFPLTENQLGIYYECAQSPDEIKYTMPAVARFGKEIDAEKLREAILKVVEAHPYLKARMVLADDGTIKQYKNNDAEIDEIVAYFTSISVAPTFIQELS